MINIHHRLAQMSSAHHDTNTTTTDASGAAPEPFSFRRTRACPGGEVHARRKLDDVRLVLQLHDELVFEVRRALLAPTSNILSPHFVSLPDE